MLHHDSVSRDILIPRTIHVPAQRVSPIFGKLLETREPVLMSFTRRTKAMLPHIPCILKDAFGLVLPHTSDVEGLEFFFGETIWERYEVGAA